MAYTDAFTDANNTDLEVHNSTWVSVSGGNTQEIQNNQLAAIAATNDSAYYYNQTANDKHYSKLTVTVKGSSGADAIGPAVRVAASDNYYYCFVDGDGNTYNGESVSASLTDWDSGVTSGSAGVVFELAIDATTSTTVLYKEDSSTVQTYTSKSSLSGGRFGVCSYSFGANSARGDDWEGGDIGGGGGRTTKNKNSHPLGYAYGVGRKVVS